MQTRLIRSMCGAGALCALAMASPPPSAAQAPSIYGRPTRAQALIDGSHGRYDGAFASTGTSGICGEIPREASLTGTATFVIEFPADLAAGAQITSVAFGSSQLVGGATSASAFRLSITVTTPKGGRPPAYVLNTDGPGDNAGRATLTRAGAATTLTVVGRNSAGETIDLSVVCG